jgi:serine phosphatase RsbU (regulator of sigma subunit)
MTQTAVRALLTAGETDPVRFLDALNRTLYHNVQRMAAQKDLSLTLLDYTPGELTLSGQHEDLIVVRQDGSVELIDTSELGMPLGLTEDISDFIGQTKLQLQTGDGLVLYTDGITEAANSAGEMYGLERLCGTVSRGWSQPAATVQQTVIDDVRMFIGEQRVYDDITLLVLKQQ